MSKQDKTTVFYNSRVQLYDVIPNVTTGFIECFDGITDSWNGPSRTTYVKIGDFGGNTAIYNFNLQTKEEFIAKLEYIQGELEKFISHLKEDTHDEG